MHDKGSDGNNDKIKIQTVMSATEPHCSFAAAAFKIVHNIKSCLIGKIYSHGFPTRDLRKSYHH